MWPTRDKIYIFDEQTAQLRKTIDLAALGATGGNLLVAEGSLLIDNVGGLIMMKPGVSNP
jgi:hypothetical protein